MRSRGRESQVLDGYEVMWREVTGKVVFSRRLERAFDCIFGIKNKNQEIYFLSGAARGLLVVLFGVDKKFDNKKKYFFFFS